MPFSNRFNESIFIPTEYSELSKTSNSNVKHGSGWRCQKWCITNVTRHFSLSLSHFEPLYCRCIWMCAYVCCMPKCCRRKIHSHMHVHTFTNLAFFFVHSPLLFRMNLERTKTFHCKFICGEYWRILTHTVIVNWYRRRKEKNTNPSAILYLVCSSSFSKTSNKVTGVAKWREKKQ